LRFTFGEPRSGQPYLTATPSAFRVATGETTVATGQAVSGRSGTGKEDAKKLKHFLFFPLLKELFSSN